MKRRGERGIALLWGILLTLAVSAAVVAVAGALARRAHGVRHMQAAEAEADLRLAGRTWGRHRLRGDPSWEGPETLHLAGGEVTVRVERPGGRPVLVLLLRVQGAREGRTIRLRP